MTIDRNDVLLAVEALTALNEAKLPDLKRLSLEHNAQLVRIGAEIRRMAGGDQPYLPMINAATTLDAIGRAKPFEMVPWGEWIRTAIDDLERLALEPPVEHTPNRAEHRAIAATSRPQ